MKTSIGKALLAASFLTGTASADPEISGWLAGYQGSTGKPWGTVNVQARDLPMDTSFFSVTHAYESDHGANVYGEYKLDQDLIGGIGPAVEWDRDWLDDDNTFRAGMNFSPDISSIIEDAYAGVRVQPFATNDKGAQVTLYGGKAFNDGDVKLEGFVDYNVAPDTWLGELHLSKRLHEDWYLTGKARYNGFKQDDEWSGYVGVRWEF